MKKIETKTMVTLSMLAAVAFLSAWLIKINVFGFLSLEPKDTILVVTGLLFGPQAAVLTSVTVSFAEFLFVSSTGWIGLIMNIISSCAFAGTAALVYKRKRTLRGALIGLVLGTLLMTVLMLIWNYIITPLYMNTSREYVASILPTVFLPFNLVKGALNTGLTLLLYKPLVRSLRIAHLLPESYNTRGQRTERSTVWGLVIAAVLLITCVMLILKWKTP